MIDPWKSWREQNQKLWTELATAQFNAIATISKRMVILLDTSTPRARRRAARESRTMLDEKIRAADRGMIAAAQTAARIGSERRPRSPRRGGCGDARRSGVSRPRVSPRGKECRAALKTLRL